MIFLALWLLHYINRTLIFPLRLHTKGKQMPLAIGAHGSRFNMVNGFINGLLPGARSPPIPRSPVHG